MKMSKKKLLTAIGPLVVAVLVVASILIFPSRSLDKPSSKTIHNAASSMSVNILKGNLVKNTAVKSGEYLPFFGSSELSRVDTFHPSVLAEKYDRPYEPFLLGSPGTQSLTHVLMLNSMKDELKGKKVVFVVSPQWFVKDGVSQQMFSFFYSPLQTYQWISELEKPDENDRYLAKRLLQFENVASDTRLKNMLQKIRDNEELSRSEKRAAAVKYQLLNNEDRLFSQFVFKTRADKITEKTAGLPNTYNVEQLEALATKTGQKSTSNNEFDIKNSFYSKRIAPMKDSLRNSQKKFNYVESPEFADFQLFLSILAKNDIDAMFVIPPVNKLWSDYTGLSEEMLNTFSKKINEQIKSQGFTNVADFTFDRSKAFFMQDTIHIGWVGWVDFDKELQKFLANEKRPTVELQSEKYLSKDWMNAYGKKKKE